MKTIYTKIVCLIFLVLCVLTSSSRAITLNMSDYGMGLDELEVHGFFSQGYLNSEKNNVYEDTKGGNFDFREFGINVSTYLTDDLLIAAQFTGYNLGAMGNDKIGVHYALADYRWKDWMGFRAGQLRMPLGLYSETRDIDMLRGSIFLPQSVYPDNMKDGYSALVGASVYGTIGMEDFGDLSYQCMAGQLVINDDYSSGVPYWQTGFGLIDNQRFIRKNTVLVDLKWDTPMDGLRLGWTFRKFGFESVGTAGHLLQALHIPASTPTVLDNPEYYTNVMSLEYSLDKLTVSAEYVKTTGSLATKINNTTLLSKPWDVSGWYVGAQYELTDKLTVGCYYDEYVPDTNDKDGTVEIAGGNKAFYSWQKTWAFYTKYDITDNWMMKFQVDFIDGVGNMRDFDLGNPADVNQHSVLMAVKSIWHF